MARDLLSARKLDSVLREATAEAARRNTRVKARDGDNLILIVRPSGGATWVLQYRFNGQRKPYTIGAWSAVTLKTARASWRDLHAHEERQEALWRLLDTESLSAQSFGLSPVSVRWRP